MRDRGAHRPGGTTRKGRNASQSDGERRGGPDELQRPRKTVAPGSIETTTGRAISVLLQIRNPKIIALPDFVKRDTISYSGTLGPDQKPTATATSPETLAARGPSAGEVAGRFVLCLREDEAALRRTGRLARDAVLDRPGVGGSSGLHLDDHVPALRDADLSNVHGRRANRRVGGVDFRATDRAELAGRRTAVPVAASGLAREGDSRRTPRPASVQNRPMAAGGATTNE